MKKKNEPFWVFSVPTNQYKSFSVHCVSKRMLDRSRPCEENLVAAVDILNRKQSYLVNIYIYFIRICSERG